MMASSTVVGEELKSGYHRPDLTHAIWEARWEVPDRYTKFAFSEHTAYGKVCTAYDQVLKRKVAVKKLSRPFQTTVHAKRTYREMKMLMHMNHENIIGLLDCFTPSQSEEVFGDVYLVTHLMEASLWTVIRTQTLTEEHVQFLVYQILCGLKYLHSAGIIHTDLKPSNIAVNEDCELKIVDLGSAEEELPGYVAARWYRAPEIMFNIMHYNQTVDVWGVGCIMAEMITGQPLFPGTDQIDQLYRIMKLVGTPSEAFVDRVCSDDAKRYIHSLTHMPKKDFRKCFITSSDDALDLLEKMLDLDVDRRITAERALAHPFFSQYHDESDEPVANVFDKSFEKLEDNVDVWRKLVYKELVQFQPRHNQL